MGTCELLVNCSGVGDDDTISVSLIITATAGFSAMYVVAV